MPAQLTYPGVYIQEIPSGVRTIIGVATSITAFLGRASRGPVNDPFTINSFGDFERTFGGLQVDYPMSYAVRDFFLNGGSQAIIVRLVHPNADPAKAVLEFAAAKTVADSVKDLAGAQAEANAVNDPIQSGNASQGEKDAAQSVFDAIVAADVTGATLDDLKKAAQGALPPDPSTIAKKAVLRFLPKEYTTAYAAAKTVADAVKDLAGAQAEAKAVNDPIQSGNASQEEKDAAQNVFKAIVAANVQGATLDGVKKAAQGALPPQPPHLDLSAASQGSWGNNLRGRIDYDNLDSVGTRYKPLGLGANDLFNLTIHDMDTGDEERFLSLAVKDGARSVAKVLEKESRMVLVQGDMPGDRPNQSDDGLLPADKKIKPFSEGETKRSVGVAEEDKGSDGSSLGTNDYINGPHLENNKWGLHALDKADLFNLLCIPPDVRADKNADDVLKSVYPTAAKYCQDRRALLIIDPPFAWGKIRATAASDALRGLADFGLTGVEGTNAAIYFPRVKETDPLSENQVDVFAACGIIAGIMARTDTQRGVWKAPAGRDASLTGIVGLQVSLNDAENGMLNPMGINVLRDFGILGRVVWGTRTLRGADQFADQWKYIPVRRTALFIEESLFRGLQWVVFEPNDEPLWAQIRLNVGAFMHDLFVQGAFQGTTPRDAYFVKCDKETTTQSDINKGIVNIVVGFAPLKPAEFVVIKLQQMAGQIQT